MVEFTNKCMRHAIFLIIVFFVSSIFASPDKNANNSAFLSLKEYWLVYHSHQDSNNKVKLLKFNSEGIVVKSARTVFPPKKFFHYPIAITDFSFPNLTIWYADSRDPLLSKLEIGRIGYEFVSQKSLKRESSFSFTNRVENNFMLYPSADRSMLRAARLNSNGGFSGENWIIYENSESRLGEPIDCDVSEDGRAVVFPLFFGKLHYLSLRKDGKPTMRKPTPVSEGNAQIQWVSVTDTLSGNHRLVAYQKNYGRIFCGSGNYGKLMTRKVNSENGKPIGLSGS